MINIFRDIGVPYFVGCSRCLFFRSSLAGMVHCIVWHGMHIGHSLAGRAPSLSLSLFLSLRVLYVCISDSQNRTEYRGRCLLSYCGWILPFLLIVCLLACFLGFSPINQSINQSLTHDVDDNRCGC